MKPFVLLCIFTLPFVADQGVEAIKQNEPATEDVKPDTLDNEVYQFIPMAPDSFDMDNIQTFLYPERDEMFQDKNSVYIIPNVEQIELNPGGMFEANPRVDLGIIYPPQTRRKIVLKDRFDGKRPKRHFYIPKPRKDESDTTMEDIKRDE